MHATFPRGLALVAAGLLPLMGCQKPAEQPQAPAATVEPEFEDYMLVFFEALPKQFDSEKNPITAEKVALGQMLYHDTRLSKNHDVSCNSCHGLDKFGVDNEKTSPGHKGQRGGRNSPTVYNSAPYVAQFWDGRSPDLEDQAKGPILNPIEMAMPSEEAVVNVLKSIPGYAPLFAKAFPDDKDPITYDNLAKAIGAFERRLVTPSKFDKFIAGDKTALNEAEKKGLAKFASLGCTTCHNGPAIGGSSFQRIGQVIAYDDKEDLGRFEVTKATADKQVFKVPSLRNIEKTGPYFHNGRWATLEETVKTMAKHQLGKELGDDEIASVITFLKTLTGELPKDLIAKPELPASGPDTPKPDPT